MKSPIRCFFVQSFLVLSSAGMLDAQWIQTNGPYGGTVQCLAASGANLYAGTYVGVFLSTNNGTNWTAVNSGLTNTNVRALAVSGTNLFVGTFGGGVFLSTNNGTSWTSASSGIVSPFINTFAVSGTNLFAGTTGNGGGVFLSTNNGTKWTAASSGLTNTNVLAFAVAGTNLFAGTRLGIFLSTNNGTNWTEVSTGLTNNYVISLAVSGTNLFAGTWGSGVWRRPLSEMITSVEPVTNELPNEFMLKQNFPNPFNPTTTIKYQLPTQNHVTLTVHNTLGQQVGQLVNEQQQAGYHDVVFRGDGLASGVYFYRIQAGDFIASKKLLLLK